VPAGKVGLDLEHGP